MKDGKSIPAFAADGKGKMKNGGKVGAKKMSMGGTMKKYATGGRVVPTVDNSMMSKGGKVMAKKAMGGKVTKKVMPKKAMGGKMGKKAC